MKGKSWAVFCISYMFLVFLSAFVVGQQSGQRIHTVVTGDTLWDLAGNYLGNPFLWPNLWEANRDKIQDPHWIYPGQEFVIPSVTPIPEVGAQFEPRVGEEGISKPISTEEAISVLATKKIPPPVVAPKMAFYGGYITEEKKVTGGYIIGSIDDKQPIGSITTFRTIYIDRGAEDNVSVGDRYAIFRIERPEKHPRTGKSLGYLVNIIGLLEVTAVHEKTSTATVIESAETIKIGDRIKPYEETIIPREVVPLPTTETLDGYLVDVKDKNKTITTFDIAYIDRGIAHGILPGDVFEIYHRDVGKGHKEAIKVSVPDRKEKLPLPDEVVGRLQVLAVRNNTATVFISNSETSNIKIGDPIRLIKKMPGEK